MAEVGMEVVFDGSAVRGGRIDVRELAPSLLAFADLVRATQSAVGRDDGSPISVQIAASDTGSFKAQLVVIAQETWGFFAEDPLQSLEMVINSTIGVITLVLARRGREVVSEGPSDIGYEMTFADGVNLQISNEVIRANSSLAVRREVRALVDPLSREGIDEIQLHTRRGAGEQRSVVITKDDLPAFDVPPADPETETSSVVGMRLRVVSPVYQGLAQWTFHNGHQQMRARVEDEGFLARVRRQEEIVLPTSVLRCRVRMDQFMGESTLRTDYVVVEVLEHEHLSEPSQQKSMFGEDDAG